MTDLTITDDVTCLGCGCTCDDIVAAVRDGRIVEARNACELGLRWFGSGEIPSSCLVDSIKSPFEDAVAALVDRLDRSVRPLIFLAPGLSSEAQREAVALADLLHARLDTISSATVTPFIVASQEMGYASATLGDIRHRADVVVFWAIDLASRYPRFVERYVPNVGALHVADGRRTTIAVDIGTATASVDTTHRVSLDPDDELATLRALDSIVRTAPALLTRGNPGAPAWATAHQLAPTLLGARYVVIIYDAEPDDRVPRSALRFSAFASLGQSLNDRTRSATVAMRAGGNRSGADANLVAQTGYPFGVDFASGAPCYDPWRGSATELGRRGEADAVIVVGDATGLHRELAQELHRLPTATIGPRASHVSLGPKSIAIDTGVDGIHASGTAFRADDVPLLLRPPLSGHRSSVDVLRSIRRALMQRQAGSSRDASAVSAGSAP